ncbi:hypothetical protein KGM_207333 [Danaus plexippus plexippus]|uniref:Uncharacterized protein n=1 Tax=Danaus plexippus plexippus TaxID=278856 RepID=A0A212EUC7_DANPL|nr:hypothetical protein KGM_207333 [Danaus plexippus plexippus]
MSFVTFVCRTSSSSYVRFGPVPRARLLWGMRFVSIDLKDSPTAGDMDRDPLEPVGLGVGLKCGVEARPAPPLPPESLLF